MAKHAVHRKKKQKNQAFSFRHAVVLCLCFIGICFGLYLWYAAFTIGQGTPAVDDDDFRPTFGPPPYRIAIDAGHGGSDPGAQGIVTEKEMRQLPPKHCAGGWRQTLILSRSRPAKAMTPRQSQQNAPLRSMRSRRTCCFPSTGTLHRKAPRPPGSSAIPVCRAAPGIRKAIISRNAWPAPCVPPGPVCGGAGESVTFITSEKKSSWSRPATPKCGQSAALPSWKMQTVRLFWQSSAL